MTSFEFMPDFGELHQSWIGLGAVPILVWLSSNHGVYIGEQPG